MQADQQIQAIADNAAAIAAQDFLSKMLPGESPNSSSSHLESLEKELQAELQDVIYSRLLWFQQSTQLELESQQQQTKLAELLSSPEIGPATPLLVNKTAQSDFAEQMLSKPFLSTDNIAPELLDRPQDSEEKPRRRRRSAPMV